MASLIDVARTFGTEDACLDFLESRRWPSGVACLKCGSDKVARSVSTVKNRRTGKVSKARRVYDCLEPACKHQFSATTGTIFHDSHLPLTKWFLAVALFINAKKSLSALQLQRDLGIGSYRTAWYLAHRIRKAMEQEGGIFGGGGEVVEMDETFVGGRYDKRRHRAPYDKQGVVGFVQRGGEGRKSQVRAMPFDKSNRRMLVGVVRENVSPDAKLYTDQSPTYKTLDQEYYRWIVNHSRGEYVRGDVSTNAVENFWSLLKRGIVGSFHSVSIKHLDRYLSEFQYRFNNRGYDLFPMTVDGLVKGRPMAFRVLVSEPAS